jgi:hypothetical protein
VAQAVVVQHLISHLHTTLVVVRHQGKAVQVVLVQLAVQLKPAVAVVVAQVVLVLMRQQLQQVLVVQEPMLIHLGYQ